MDGDSRRPHGQTLQPVMVFQEHEGCLGLGAGGQILPAQQQPLHSAVLLSWRLKTCYGRRDVDLQGKSCGSRSLWRLYETFNNCTEQGGYMDPDARFT